MTEQEAKALAEGLRQAAQLVHDQTRVMVDLHDMNGNHLGKYSGEYLLRKVADGLGKENL